MSIEMTLEADEGLAKGDVVRASEGVAVVKSEGDRVSGAFPLSGMTFYGEFHVTDPVLLTEVVGEKWRVGSRMAFQLVIPKYGECMRELGVFIARLASLSRACFVVAFEYETPYAVRNERGLQLLKPELGSG